MLSSISRRKREGSRPKIKSMGDHKEFLKRITKTLYYGQLPKLPCLSLPVTEVSCSVWSALARGRSLRRLRADAAAGIARGACVSPCALVLALLYLERLHACNQHYLAAAAPADLFLVSLMVGNKFLQDDGEDDDVICSEWAASGGIDLKQLKKLEMEFLNAIDWKVYVSEKSFEEKLAWLERCVALRQAKLRGFFTYTDLTAGDQGGAAELASALLAGWLAASLGYLAAMAAMLATALLAANTLPALQALAPAAPAPAPPAAFVSNATHPTHIPPTLPDPLDMLDCCTKWTKYRENIAPKRNWYDAVLVDIILEPWWSKTSALSWLYQSSLVNPMQRWLERINEYADLIKFDFLYQEDTKRKECSGYVKHDNVGSQHCVRQWLNFSKLSALAATMSDR